MRVLAGAVLALSLAMQADPEPIQRMAATERAFAAAAAEIGTRDAFLAFLADDAVRIQPGPTGRAARLVPARPEVTDQPLAKLPLGQRLLWEPFTGHISGDGSLGWLTGAYATLNLPTRSLANQGAYFSVWRRQANGTWRVWLDDGVPLPDVWQNAAPFRAAPEPDAGTAGSPDEALDAAEHAVANGGELWQARLADSIRLHRAGRMPIEGKTGVVQWAQSAWTSVTFTLLSTLAADSNDLGVGVGGYDAKTSTGAEHGTWARVWKRDSGGRWRIVFETSQAAR